MNTVRRVVGNSSTGAGCIVALAVAVAQEARGFGLQVLSLKVSRSRGSSTSRYLEVEDGLGRNWSLRISNHYRPKSSPFAPPHFDLVSLDGRAGVSEARAFLLGVATGEAAWSERPVRRRHRKKARRCNFKRLRNGRQPA